MHAHDTVQERERGRERERRGEWERERETPKERENRGQSPRIKAYTSCMYVCVGGNGHNNC